MLDYHTTMLLENLEETNAPIINYNDEGLVFWKTEVKTENDIYSVCLFRGFCLYHPKVQERGKYDKYLPAYSEDDYFIRVSCESNIDISIADSLAVALVFELQAAHNIFLEKNGRTPRNCKIHFPSSSIAIVFYVISSSPQRQVMNLKFKL